MKKQPKISIIVPIYNVESYLHTCVDSIINQTYANLEIILVDDESPDNCGAICDDYAKQDERVKVIHQKNKGLSGARNSGMKIATGDYIAFVDSDDWVELNMYEHLLTLAEENNLAIIEGGILERENDTALREDFDISKVTLQIESYPEAYKRIISEARFSVWRRLYKKEIVTDYLFKEGKISEDVYFTIDNIKKADRIGHFLYPFYNYRSNPTSITRQSYSIKDFDALEAAMYLYNTVVGIFPSNDEIKLLARQHLLKRLFRHYRLLNYNSFIDPDFKHRLNTKKLITKYYSKNHGAPIKIKMARYFPLWLFTLSTKLHKLKIEALPLF